MYEKFRKLCALGDNIGTVTEAMMYRTGYMTIYGKLTDGTDFTLTLTIKEEETDGN
jgi:hypothetical protein